MKLENGIWLVFCFPNSLSNFLITQSVITTRIYVLHKITIALKFMSYINSDLPIPAKKLQTQTSYGWWINGLEAVR